MNKYERYMQFIGKPVMNTELKIGSKGFHEKVNAYGFAEPHVYFKFIGLWLHAYISVCEIDFSKSGYIAEFSLDVVPNDNINTVKSCVTESICTKYEIKDLITHLYKREIEELIYQEYFYFKDKKKKMRRKNKMVN